jgi:hypothetical protein
MPRRYLQARAVAITMPKLVDLTVNCRFRRNTRLPRRYCILAVSR